MDDVSEQSDSGFSDVTLYEPDHQPWSIQSTHKQSYQCFPRRGLNVSFKYASICLLRSLLLLGYATVFSGLVAYGGKCRGSKLNLCLGHFIKASVFLFWGLLSFGRYLGAWSELGWAWNKKPISQGWRKHAPTAEGVESFVIFFYG